MDRSELVDACKALKWKLPGALRQKARTIQPDFHLRSWDHLEGVPRFSDPKAKKREWLYTDSGSTLQDLYESAQTRLQVEWVNEKEPVPTLTLDDITIETNRDDDEDSSSDNLQVSFTRPKTETEKRKEAKGNELMLEDYNHWWACHEEEVREAIRELREKEEQDKYLQLEKLKEAQAKLESEIKAKEAENATQD